MKAMFIRTGNPHWESITKFWLKIFSLTFALGVATGIPLQFSLGTNWSRYSRFVGDVFGSVIGAEGFFAFLIEAGFLGVLLFGWNRISSKMHLMAAIFVSLGAHFSAIWIVAANSWQHTPGGYTLAPDPDGMLVAHVTDWWQMAFGGSSIPHIIHVFFSAWLSAAFLLISVAAYYLLKNRFHNFARTTMKVGLAFAVFCVIGQLISSDKLSSVIAKENPEKFAALEGVFKTEPSTAIHVLGWVDQDAQKVYGIAIPGVLSFLTYRDFKTPVKGLEDFPKEEWPKVNLVFQMYHIMVIMWLFMAIVAGIGVYYWWKRKWQMKKWILRIMVLSVVFPQVANITGWYTSCFGRQPWTVYKLLKTADAFSPKVTAGQAWGSLSMFFVMYLLFFAMFLYLLDEKIKHGPKLDDEEQLPYRDPFKNTN